MNDHTSSARQILESVKVWRDPTMTARARITSEAQSIGFGRKNSARQNQICVQLATAGPRIAGVDQPILGRTFI